MIVELSSAERRALRARAHVLSPVVSVAQLGLTPGVVAEIERSLNAHELIKIRVYGEDREMRDALMAQICDMANAASVQHIGNILVIYRKNPPARAATEEAKKPAAAPARGAKGTRSAAEGGRKLGGAGNRAGASARPGGARAGTSFRAARGTAGSSVAAPRRRATSGGKGRGGK